MLQVKDHNDFFCTFTPILLFDSRGSLGCHNINLLNVLIKPESFSTLVFVTRAGFFVCLLSGIFHRVFLEYFTLLHGAPGDTQQAWFFAGLLISRTACIMFLTLAITTLIRVGWQGGLYQILFTTMTDRICLFPISDFIRCYYFVELLCNFLAFEHVAFLLVGLYFKLPSLRVGMFGPSIRNGTEKDFIQFFGSHHIGFVWCGEEW